MLLSNYFHITVIENIKNQEMHPNRKIIWLTTRMVRMAKIEIADNQIMVVSEVQDILFCLMILDRVLFYEFLAVFSNMYLTRLSCYKEKTKQSTKQKATNEPQPK